jgi:hypothetical protein
MTTREIFKALAGIRIPGEIQQVLNVFLAMTNLGFNPRAREGAT